MNNATEKLEVNQLYESNIITKNEIPLLIGWLPKHPSKIIKIFDTKQDTHNAGAFHQKCDNKGTTVVLVKTNSNNRFGGYTSESQGRSSEAYAYDSSAFLFSFDTKKKYNVNTPNYAIYCNATFGPTFGNGHDLHISNYGPQNNNNYTNGMAYPLETIHELNKGTKNFIAEIYEVYQIIYPENQIKIFEIKQ